MRLLLLLPATTYRADAFIKAAARISVNLTVGSDHTSVFAATQPDVLIRLDFRNPEKAADQAEAFARRHPLAAVFGVDDDTAVIAAHIARRLGLPHASVEACEAARDKHRQRVVMRQAGVRVPDFTLQRFDGDLGAAARAMRYPVVLKPTHLSMSRGVIRADDPAAFVAAARRVEQIVVEQACGGEESFLAEQFIGGPEVAVEALLTGGELRVLAIFDKPDPLDGPYFEETIYATPSALEPAAQQAIARCVADAARAIGLDHGPVHAEVRWHEGQAWLIELAARPIGGKCSRVLRFSGHESLEDLLLAHALGRELQAGSWQLEGGGRAVMMIPTPKRGVLQSVDGIEEARAVPGIEGVDISVGRGQEVVPLPEGNRYLGFIYAGAADAADAVSALRRSHALLRPTIV